jgi:hypothetical protein
MPESLGTPEFRLVEISVGAETPARARDELSARGVPAGLIAHEYRALAATEIVSTSGGNAVVAFGSWASSGRVCIDSASGAVVSVPVPGATETTVVNVDLAHFVKCVAAVIERFPFYDDDTDFDDWEVAGDDIAGILESLDGQALGHNSFWATFVADIKIGDYSTEIVVGD